MPVEFKDNSLKVKAALNEKTIAWLHEAAGEIESQSKRNTRVDTGQLKNSWANTVDESDGTATVGSPLENAIWEEFGTGEYALHHNGRKGGWVYQSPKGEFYYTKGKTPNRPLYNAFTTLKNKLVKRFGEILKSKMGG